MRFRLVPKSMILNNLEWRNRLALILHYFNEFVYDVVVKQLPRFQNLLLIVCGQINTICTIIQRLFVQNKL